MKESLDKYNKFHKLIIRYSLTKLFIKNKKHSFLKLMLNKNITIYQAFDIFLEYQEEIDKAINNYRIINKILGSLNKKELYIIKAYVIKNKTCEEVSNYLGLTQRTFFRRYSKLVDNFMMKFAQEKSINTK